MRQGEGEEDTPSRLPPLSDAAPQMPVEKYFLPATVRLPRRLP